MMHEPLAISKNSQRGTWYPNQPSWLDALCYIFKRFPLSISSISDILPSITSVCTVFCSRDDLSLIYCTTVTHTIGNASRESAAIDLQCAMLYCYVNLEAYLCNIVFNIGLVDYNDNCINCCLDCTLKYTTDY